MNNIKNLPLLSAKNSKIYKKVRVTIQYGSYKKKKNQ